MFTGWYAALRLAATTRPPAASREAAYREAAALLDGAGMPGLEQGLLPLALLSLRLSDAAASGRLPGSPDGRPLPARLVEPDADWGPYRPWIEPFALLDEGRRPEASETLRALPEPPADLLYEALCCLEAAVALDLGDRNVLERVRARLLPASGELAGAGSGLLSFGPVDRWLAAVTAALERPATGV
nr:hypothetical protein [Actinomadura fibrosa]